MFYNLPALLISIFTHALVLGGLWFYTFKEKLESPQLVVETVFAEEQEDRSAEEYMQEMAFDTTVSSSLSVVGNGGGTVTGKLGATRGNPVGQQSISQAKGLKGPKVNNMQYGIPNLPGAVGLGLDLGEGEVSGEVGARVEGYGAAMHRMTQELRRMMRDRQVIVVWLFDASKSLEDDRKEIGENFHKIYEELEIAREQAERKNQKYHSLETLVCSFGGDLKKLMPKPSADLKEIRGAIAQIAEDKSGKEMTFNSIRAVLEEYGKIAKSTDRKLAVVVLSDETGDDADILEDVVDKAKLYGAPIFFLGREAVFGYPYARVSWMNPETKITYWTNVDRGPETALPECLQYDGFGERWDSASSGFAPYPQARLVNESGGIFFVLQTQEQNLSGNSVRAQLARKFEDIRMKQYEPELVSVRDYVRERDGSEFRKAVWTAVTRLNPEADRDLHIRDHYAIDFQRFQEEGREPFQRGLRAMKLISAAIADVEKVRPLREKEPDARWRAAYDLVYAQLLAYRVRLFQFLLALDQHAVSKPKPASPKSNRWDRTYATKLLEPTEKQIQQTGVDLKELEKQKAKALEMYKFIIDEHPGTPWAQRAEQERAWGFGIRFVDKFWDEKYFDQAERAKIPKF